MSTPQMRLWRAVLPWEQADEGHFTSEAWAQNSTDACIAVASEMADADATLDFVDLAHREDWISARAGEAISVFDVRMQVRQTLYALFADDLQLPARPGGGEICWSALTAVMRIHRRALFPDTATERPPQSFVLDQVIDGEARQRVGHLVTVHEAVHDARMATGGYALTVL
ncbi:hypothetical protein [Achromobacter sp. DH1f]|uniref:hypothetical protein n=1 Tax=Achromobacter sp. DH1f TaxID=1397275 RepID=UPI000469BDFE|nr:hypothetical protein [Achromobacter sp. DH1f]